VKIPVTTTRGEASSELVRELSHAGVRINVTAICTLGQVRANAEALAGGAPSVISVFAGRIADTGLDPVPIMREAGETCRRAATGIELLWASPREILNVVQALEAGVDIITLTDDLRKKLDLLGKDLAEYSLETVRMFHGDARGAGYTL
jgi:transaldolase